MKRELPAICRRSPTTALGKSGETSATQSFAARDTMRRPPNTGSDGDDAARNFYRAAATAVLVAAAVAAQALPASAVSAAEVASEIRTVGAKAALARLYETGVWSTSIYPGIASGSLAWFRVAEQLKAVADGAAAEDIDAALMDSLASAPLRVLPELSRIYGESFEAICDLSFEAESPKAGVATYILGIRKKLSAAKTVPAKSMAAACNRGLDESLRHAAEQGLR